MASLLDIEKDPFSEGDEEEILGPLVLYLSVGALIFVNICGFVIFFIWRHYHLLEVF